MKRTSRTPTRIGPFTRLSTVWRLTVLSLTLDGVVALFLNTTLSTEQAYTTAALCAVLTLPFLNQRALARRVAALRRVQADVQTKKRRITKAALPLLLATIVVAKLAALPAVRNVVSLLAAAILLLGIISSLQHIIREGRAQSARLRSSPWLYVNLWERQLLIIFSVPMIAARLVSACGALSLGTSPHPIYGAIYVVVSVLLLLALKPDKTAFVGWCPRCKSPAPIAFVEYGSCPHCDAQVLSTK